MRTVFGITVLLSVLIIVFAGCGKQSAGDRKNAGSGSGGEARTLILGAYTVPKEAFQKSLIPAFQNYWKEKTGEDVRFKESYVGSGAQARAIIGGFEADIAVLSLEEDMDEISKAGLIAHDWRSKPHNGFITNSVVVIGVRPGNPKGIKDWEDLAAPGVDVLYPNPKTSGGAMWDVNAIYGAALKYSEETSGRPDPEFARELLKMVQKNVKVMDKSGRESFTTFEKGIGDAVVTYENELLRVLAEGEKYEVVYPRSTILIENPAAVIDQNIQKHGTADVAEAFIDFLHSAEGQQAFGEAGFRPLDEQIAGRMAKTYPEPQLLFGIEYLGGWSRVREDLYGPKGVWMQILEELAQS
ncbi:MAG: sulfate ABC transporter substrate-binding protein [Bacillota bacterium]